MSMFDEIKRDAAQSGALLGGILAFVFLFWIWASGGLWLLATIAILGALGFILFKLWRSGRI